MTESTAITTRTPLRCIICKTQPESAFGDHVDDAAARQPYGATMFTSHGHYGSTAFDPMGDMFLEINICDDCLQGENASDTVALGQPVHVRREVAYKPWVIGEDRV